MSERWVSLPELGSVIGDRAARDLCREFGGLSVYVPARGKADHEFARVIGEQAMQALCAYAGGYHVALPNLRRPESQKDRILGMLETGATHREIAEECKVSERWVRRLASERREVEMSLPL